MKKVHAFTASLGEKLDNRRETEGKLATMIITIVLIFVVCNSFESITFILHIQEILPLDIFQQFLRPLADLLMVINSSVNIFIYCAFKRNFREKFFQMYFLCKWRKTKKPKTFILPDKNSDILPMIRAQLPKTSVELTYYASKECQQQALIPSHKITNLKALEETTSSIQSENANEAKPSISDSDTGYDSSLKETSFTIKAKLHIPSTI